MSMLIRHKFIPAALVSLCALALVISPGCSSNEEDAEEPQSRLFKVTFSVPDMCCSSCAMKTKMALENYGGVEKAYANFLEKEAWARYDPNMVEAALLQRAVKALGFKEVTIVSDERYVPEPITVAG
jgi:copper chaperone CopZ